MRTTFTLLATFTLFLVLGTEAHVAFDSEKRDGGILGCDDGLLGNLLGQGGILGCDDGLIGNLLGDN